MTKTGWTLYTKPNCKNCPIAKRFLDLNKIQYEELSLDSPELISAFKEQYPDIRSVPAIFDSNGNRFVAWEKV
jgi:glutaredoxin